MTHKFEQEAPLTTGLYKSPDTTIHNFKSGVGVPLAQSFAVSCLVMLVVSTFRLAWMYPTEWWSWTLFVGSVIWLIQFLAGVGFWKWVIRGTEQITQVDLNRDGAIGEPPKVVYVDMPEGSAEYPAVTRHELPFADRLPTFAAGIKQGKPLTHAVWVSGKSTDKLFSSGEFSTLTEIMLENKWIELVNQRDVTRGYKMTRAGMAVMRSLATTHPLGDDLSDGWVRR